MFEFLFYSSGTLDINCSKDIKIQGIIGPCTSLEKVVIYTLVHTFVTYILMSHRICYDIMLLAVIKFAEGSSLC